MLKKALRDHILNSCSEQEITRWFDPLGITLSKSEKRLFITFPHQFFASWFQSNVQDKFEALLGEYLGEGYRLGYSIQQSVNTVPVQPVQTRTVEVKNLDMPFGRQHTFETYFFNKKNAFPVASAREVARTDTDQSKYNPFVLCGPSGTGKTHLLCAIGNEIASKMNRDQIFFGTVEDLASVYAERFEGDTYSARRFITAHKYLILDDLQRLKDFPMLQEELVVIFNAMHDSDHQMVFAANDTLGSYEFLDPKLKSRLEWGLIAQLKSQDLDLRVKFVQHHLKEYNVRLNKEQIFMLCQRFPDFRNLQGVLLKLSAYRDLMSREVTNRDFEQILQHTDDSQSTPLTSEIILTVVAEHFSITPKDIVGGKRHQKIVLARQIAMFLCRQLLGSSYPALGRIFGGKDHSTAMYAVKKVKQLQESNKDTKLLVTTLKKKCLDTDK